MKYLWSCILFFTFSVLLLSSCSIFESKERMYEDELLVYREIFAFLSDSVPCRIYLENDSRSILHYVTESTFSRDLYGKDPHQYLAGFFAEKHFDVPGNLINAFMDMNEDTYPLNIMMPPTGDVEFITALSIDYYRNNKISTTNPLYNAIHDSAHFEALSLSRVGFSDFKSQALVQVMRHFINRSEDYFVWLIKENEHWKVKEICYVHGPNPVRRKR